MHVHWVHSLWIKWCTLDWSIPGWVGDRAIGEIGQESVSSESEVICPPTPSAGLVQCAMSAVLFLSPPVWPRVVSISGLMPQPRANPATAWMWAMIATAWTNSDTDQLSAPDNRSCGSCENHVIRDNDLCIKLATLTVSGFTNQAWWASSLLRLSKFFILVGRCWSPFSHCGSPSCFRNSCSCTVTCDTKQRLLYRGV